MGIGYAAPFKFITTMLIYNLPDSHYKMRKTHAKQKRYNRSGTHLRSIRPKTRTRKRRSKSFATQEAAVKYAEKLKLKKFVIGRGPFSKKFWIKF